MAAENSPSNNQIKALEEQLAQMRKLQEQTESQLAELARQQSAAEEAVAGEVAVVEAPTETEIEAAPKIEVRVVEKAVEQSSEQREMPSDAADPPKLDASGQGVLGALKRKIETVSGRGEQAAVAQDDDVHAHRAEDSDASTAAFAAIEEKLDGIVAQLASAPHEPHAATHEALQQVMNEVVSAVTRHAQATEQQAHTIRGDLQTLHAQAHQVGQLVVELNAKEEPPPEPESIAPGGLDEAICGESLAANVGLAQARQDLIAGFLAGERAAMGLAGQLLMFQSTPGDRMPSLLKDVGEAYYRWRPQAAHAADPFQHALMEWLMQTCEQGGSANRIELARPGDRYDAARHHAKTRGLEITEVFGWIVLRDNGKVYTKASVAVK